MASQPSRSMVEFVRVCILVKVTCTVYRRLQIGRDGHLDQSEAYDISARVRKYGPMTHPGRII